MTARREYRNAGLIVARVEAARHELEEADDLYRELAAHCLRTSQSSTATSIGLEKQSAPWTTSSAATSSRPVPAGPLGPCTSARSAHETAMSSDSSALAGSSSKPTTR